MKRAGQLADCLNGINMMIYKDRDSQNRLPGMLKRAAAVMIMMILLNGLFTDNALAEKRYRALLIGQTYSGVKTYTRLPGCAEDALAMEAMLREMGGTPYETHVELDLNGSDILIAISETFRESQEEDVCLFYYTGHGQQSNNNKERGALVGTDGETIALDKLCEQLLAVPGEKILILDSCYAGSVLPYLISERANGPEDVSIRALLAAGPDEQAHSVQTAESGEAYGTFTRSLINGSTEDETKRLLPADRNRDGAISIMEAYYYVRNFSDGPALGSTAMVYPENVSGILWARESVD